jgi:hypothetical protein
VQNTFFIKRRESYKTPQWENPKERGKEKVTPETNTEKHPPPSQERLPLGKRRGIQWSGP